MKETIIQFIIYGTIGGLNVIIDFSFLNLMMYLTGIQKGFMLFIFNVMSFFMYSTSGYFLNKKFTFKNNTSTSYYKYIAVLGSAMIVNGIILSTLSLHNLLNVSPLLWANICKLIASITTGTVSFIVNKLYVFKKC